MSEAEGKAFFGETQAVDPVVNALLVALGAFDEVPRWYLKLALVSCYEFLETSEQLVGKMRNVCLSEDKN
jgi:hypothetical protein